MGAADAIEEKGQRLGALAGDVLRRADETLRQPIVPREDDSAGYGHHFPIHAVWEGDEFATAGIRAEQIRGHCVSFPLFYCVVFVVFTYT